MKKILVIDDEADIRDVIRLILEEEGYAVSELDNGCGTTTELVSSVPDLILLDVMLGELDGRDICRQLKADHRFIRIPIIMISATHDLGSTEEKGCLADDYIAKPFDIAELIRKVALHLSQK